MHFTLSTKPLLGSAVAVILLAVFIWYALVPSSKSKEGLEHSDSTNVTRVSGSSPSDVVFPVEVAVARRGDLVKRLSTTGIIRANREVEIVSRTAGEIIFVGAQNGDYVKLGDVLVKLDDREYKLAYARASAGLLSAQIEYRTLSTSPFLASPDSIDMKQKKEEVQRKLRDADQRFIEGAISEENFARLKRDYETELAVYNAQRSDVVATKSGLSQAIEAYERSKLDLESTQIKAPFAGHVADCDLSTGKRVAQQQVLLKIVDVSRLLVDVEVLESEIGKVQIGRKAEVNVNAYPNDKFVGTVFLINPVVDAKSKTVKVTVQLSVTRRRSSHDSPRLRPGMFATVKIETEILKDCLLVPKEALLVRDQRALVFVAQSGLAKWQYVELGEENERYVELKSAVLPGDSVIISGHYTLAHDAKVSILR